MMALKISQAVSPDISVQEITGKATEYLGSMKRKDGITMVIFTGQPFEPMVINIWHLKFQLNLLFTWMLNTSN
jgi:hypothetical protein